MGTIVQNRIGLRIKALREEKKLKQKDMAQALSMSLSAYSKIENGERGLSSENCIDIANFFGVSCDYILRGIVAENVDICIKTGLEQETIECLTQMQEERKKCIAAYNECISVNTETSLFLKKIQEINASNAVIYILNSFCRETDLLKTLANACYDSALVGVITNNDYTANYGFVQNGKYYSNQSFSEFSMFNASQYVAGQAFAQFFKELCTNKEFISKLL